MPVEQRPPYLLLIDPEWTPSDDAPDQVPAEVVIGVWLTLPDGARGRFEPNPAYRPSTPDLPLDPVDGAMRGMAKGELGHEELLVVLRDVVVGVALDEEGIAIVRPAPDGVASVWVTTSYGHRGLVDAAGWRNTTLPELAAALPADGVDVLLNPGAETSLRLLAEVIRAAAHTPG